MSTPNILFLIGIPDKRLARIVFDESGNPDLKLEGNCAVDYLKKDPRISGAELTLGGPGNVELELDSRPDLVFNRICSPEGNGRALEMAIRLSETFERDNIPILNHPKRVLLSSRDRAPSVFEGIEGLVVPSVRCFKSPRLKEIIELLDSGEISYPFIIRTVADHNGRNMVRVMEEADLENLDVLPFDGRDYVIVRYVDYSDEHGYFTKYRLLKMGDTFVPRQLIISDRWRVHGEDMENELSQKPQIKEKRNSFRSDPAAIIGKKAMDVLNAVFERLGLDYAGVDFSLLPDGRVLLFEANACMKIVMKNRSEKAAKRNAGIKDGFIEYIYQRARK
jgi:glutathione synthase/RimK-type ligase-like ATP-grasp enzyme